jgi:carbonic anhydrase
MSVADELIRNNRRYADSFRNGDLPISPARRVAIVTCMDARLDIHGLLGLEVGEAHVIRNAGGVVTDDVVRSLLISQRLLGTREIVLIHHTDCGMVTFRDDDVKQQVYEDSRWRLSTTHSGMFASRSPGSKRVPSWRARWACAGSSSM